MTDAAPNENARRAPGEAFDNSARRQACSPDSTPPILAAALHAHGLGLDVMPCLPRRKEPGRTDWQTRDPYTAEELRTHWAREPRSNYGIRTGRSIGDGSAGFLAVADLDAIDHEALAEVQAVAREWLGDWSAVPETRSGGGIGCHLFYRTETPAEGRTVRESPDFVTKPDGKRKRRWKLELKGAGHQVIGAGSVHPDTGRTYEWVREFTPDAAPLLPPIPPHWLDKPTPQRSASNPAGTVQPSASAGGSARRRLLSWLASCAEAVRQAPEGDRNDTLNKRTASAAGARIGAEGLDPGEVRSAMLPAALASGLEEGESLATIASALRFAEANPFQLPDRPRPLGAASSSDPPPDPETLAAIAALRASGKRQAETGTGEGEPADPCAGLPCFRIVEWEKGLRNGVHWFGLIRDKETDAVRPAPPVWICDPLRVTALTRDDRGHEWGRLLEWLDGDGRLHRWAMPCELLAGSGEELRAALLRRGLAITSGAERRRLADYVQGERPTVRARSVTRTGWSGGAFVWPDHTEGGSDAEPVVLQLASPDGVAIGQGGTLDGWRQEVAAPCAGNSRLVLALSVAFAGPCLHPLRAEGGGFHFRGKSSAGKSTALEIAGSVYGPAEFLRSWRATDNALEGVASLHSDVLLCLDELKELPAKAAGAVAYMLANGQGKSRAARDGSARASARWRVLFLSSGEIGLADLMAAVGEKIAAGMETRFVDLPADAGAGFGLFERVPLADSMTATAAGERFADSLKAAAATHYGHAGRAWVRWLVQHHAEARDALRQLRDAIAAELAPADAAGQVRRVAQRFALVAAAGEVATAQGFTGWTPGEATEAAAVCFRAWLDARGTAGSSEPAAMLRQVRAFLEAHGDARFTPLDSAPQRDGGNLSRFPPPQRDTRDRAGFRRDAGEGAQEFLILPEVFRQEVCKGFDSKAVADALAEAKALKLDSKGGRTLPQRLPGLGVVRVYAIGPALWGAADG